MEMKPNLIKSDSDNFKKFVGWQCIEVYASFFLIPCGEHGFINPLKIIINTELNVFFTHFFSKKLKKSELPKVLLHTNR
jgi:hypothetical protein